MDLHVDDNKLLRARNDLSERLHRRCYPWLRGVGIGTTSDGRPCIVVCVRTLTSYVLDLIPPHTNGIPVRVEELGQPSAHRRAQDDGDAAPVTAHTLLRHKEQPLDEPVALAIVAIVVVGVFLLATMIVEALAGHPMRFAGAMVALLAYSYFVHAYQRALLGWFHADTE